jgi:hypothetical protein
MKDINRKMIMIALVFVILAILSVIFAVGFQTKNEVSKTSTTTSTTSTTTATSTTISEIPNKIILETPKANQTVGNPIKISGQARGTWFFEATFPVNIVDWDGKIVGSGVAHAKEDWMTGNFVPFEAEIFYTLPPQIYSKKGAIILKKDNPSGDPGRDEALEVPVVFQ